MIEPAREREEAAEQLRELAHEEEGTERDEEDGDDGVREGDEACREERTGGRHAERAEEVDEVRRLQAGLGLHGGRAGERTYGEVHINVFKVEQNGEEHATS